MYTWLDGCAVNRAWDNNDCKHDSHKHTFPLLTLQIATYGKWSIRELNGKGVEVVRIISKEVEIFERNQANKCKIFALTDTKKKGQGIEKLEDCWNGRCWLHGYLLIWGKVVGSYGKEVLNDSGERILTLCIANTKFPHKEIHKWARVELSRNEKSVTDHIFQISKQSNM